MNEIDVITKEKLMADMRVVIADAEELLRATANGAGDKLAAARDKAEASLRTARMKLAEAEQALVAKTKAAAKATDDYVHDHPWRAVGIAAGAGLIIGLLIGRR